MNTLPEPVQFYLDACERISARGVREGIEVLTPIERLVFRAYIFDCEEQNGSLSQFFYNTDSSPEIAEQTAAALESIGTPKTAALLRSAAAAVCRADARSFVGTWSGYLTYADPGGQLDICMEQMGHTGESVADALQTFVISHRHDLEDRAA